MSGLKKPIYKRTFRDTYLTAKFRLKGMLFGNRIGHLLGLWHEHKPGEKLLHIYDRPGKEGMITYLIRSLCQWCGDVESYTGPFFVRTMEELPKIPYSKETIERLLSASTKCRLKKDLPGRKAGAEMELFDSLLFPTFSAISKDGNADYWNIPLAEKDEWFEKIKNEMEV